MPPNSPSLPFSSPGADPTARESPPVTVESVQNTAVNAESWRGPARRRGAWVYLALSVGVFALTVVLEGSFMKLLPSARAPMIAVGVLGFGASVVLAGLGILVGTRRLLERPDRSLSLQGWLIVVMVTVGSLFMMLLGAVSALFATTGFSRGRQLRRRGRVLLAPLHANAQWATSSDALAPMTGAPAGVAEQWRENGRTEHASVASFARLTLDLMALGAPPALITAANLDALDEIRHTEACFSLAQALDGKAESPGPFPEAQRAHTLPGARGLALAKLAVMSLVDGALHEGVSARIIAKLARRCEDPTISGILKQLAADEGRHAAHGWDVVEWCLEEGGPSVAYALLGALRSLPERMHSPLPQAAVDGAWEAWGIHGRQLEVEEYSATRQHLIERVRSRVAAVLPGGELGRAA